MLRENILDLLNFLAIAREKSFTRAAAKLQLSPSALSHAMRALEERMGMRLLTRTTRSVTTTDAGDRLVQQLTPHLEEMEREIAAVHELREKPAGTIRITATDYVIDTLLWPRLSNTLLKYPGIKLEMMVDYGLTDIVRDRFDIGVRGGDQVDKDMIAVRISPDYRLAIVAAPSYLNKRPEPRLPQELVHHDCIGLRLPTQGGVYAWELKKQRRALQVRVEAQITCNSVYQMLNAALSGNGLAFIPEELAIPYVDAGQLRWVLEDWFPTFQGFHLYYPSRRGSSRALSVVVDALRLRTSA